MHDFLLPSTISEIYKQLCQEDSAAMGSSWKKSCFQKKKKARKKLTKFQSLVASRSDRKQKSNTFSFIRKPFYTLYSALYFMAPSMLGAFEPA